MDLRGALTLRARPRPHPREPGNEADIFTEYAASQAKLS